MPTEKEIEAAAKAICQSAKFETGEGTCAFICMDQLGDQRRRGCTHAKTVHEKIAHAALEAAEKVRKEER